MESFRQKREDPFNLLDDGELLEYVPTYRLSDACECLYMVLKKYISHIYTYYYLFVLFHSCVRYSPSLVPSHSHSSYIHSAESNM